MSLRGQASKILTRTNLCRLFTIKKHGVVIRFNPTRMSQRLWLDSYESKSIYDDTENFFLKYLHPGDVVVDVGANIGWYTLLCAASVGKEGRVYAFEAHPTTFQYLEENTGLNDFDHVELYELAIGNAYGEIQLPDSPSDGLNKVITGDGVSVAQRRLDELIPAGPIALIKIDVEGFELFVLQGAIGILEHVQTILFEIWDEHTRPYGYEFKDVYDLLTKAGFTIIRRIAQGYIEVNRDYAATDIADLIAVRDQEAFLARMD